MKINIILEKVPIDSFKYETINIVLEEDEISWNKIFNVISEKTNLPAHFFKLRYMGKIYTYSQNNFEELKNLINNCSNMEINNFIIFEVGFDLKEIKERNKNILYKIKMLECSISSLHACGRSTTDLYMEIVRLKGLLS